MALKAYEELADGSLFVGMTRSVGQERTVLLCRLEPEHECVVLFVVALEEVVAQP